MDDYQGYHQTFLAKADKDKVSFIMAEGTFCYTVMLFGLMNVGAMYQWFMDKVFAKLLGCNIEVYMNDILIKTGDTGTGKNKLAIEPLLMFSGQIINFDKIQV